MEEKFIGKTLGVDVEKEAIMEEFKCNSCRVIHTDDMVTMDYMETRVNICVDNSNVIERIYIG